MDEARRELDESLTWLVSEPADALCDMGGDLIAAEDLRQALLLARRAQVGRRIPHHEVLAAQVLGGELERRLGGLVLDEVAQLGVVLVDIGGGTTDVAIFTQGAIRHTAVIPIAGDQITSDRVGKRRPEMNRSKFSEAQIAFVLKQAEESKLIGEVCRKAGSDLPRDLFARRREFEDIAVLAGRVRLGEHRLERREHGELHASDAIGSTST